MHDLDRRVYPGHTDILLTAQNRREPLPTNAFDRLYGSDELHAVADQRRSRFYDQFRTPIAETIRKHPDRFRVNPVLRNVYRKLRFQFFCHLTENAAAQIDLFRNDADSVDQFDHSLRSGGPILRVAFGKVALQNRKIHVGRPADIGAALFEIIAEHIKSEPGNHSVVNVVIDANTQSEPLFGVFFDNRLEQFQII